MIDLASAHQTNEINRQCRRLGLTVSQALARFAPVYDRVEGLSRRGASGMIDRMKAESDNFTARGGQVFARPEPKSLGRINGFEL